MSDRSDMARAIHAVLPLIGGEPDALHNEGKDYCWPIADAARLVIATDLATMAHGLQSCAGCSTEPLQECYIHGENAAKFYIDYAINAMYHFAGIEKPDDVSRETLPTAEQSQPPLDPQSPSE